MLLSSTVSWSVGERLSGPWALGKEGSKRTSWGPSLSGSCSGCQLVMGTRLSLQEEDMCQVAQIFTVVPCFIGKYNGSCSHQLPQSRSGRLKSDPSMSQSLSGAFGPSVSDGLWGGSQPSAELRERRSSGTCFTVCSATLQHTPPKTLSESGKTNTEGIQDLPVKWKTFANCESHQKLHFNTTLQLYLFMILHLEEAWRMLQSYEWWENCEIKDISKKVKILYFI